MYVGAAFRRPKRMATIRLGSFELISLTDGFFALDGGAMFGVVPKPLWERVAPPDARNRIRMAMRPLLVRGAHTVLIDAGAGDKMDARAADIYGFDREYRLEHSLQDAGVNPRDIDVVIASHLHFDHAGGFTVRDSDGKLRPRFPAAQHIARRQEWEDALAPHERNRASYFSENYVPLQEAALLTLVDEDAEVLPGVRLRRTGGHTRGHQMIHIESGGRTAVFVADLIPTTAHVPLAWIMGYDLYPMETLEFKRAFLREALEREYLLLFEHDPKVAAGYLRERNGKVIVDAV
jgi:glyoxylase-like metal-dependent hydrolase (beta-lactamase superfamily II)